MNQQLPKNYLEPTTVKCGGQVTCGTCRDCKSILNIGIFFDGTSNNMYEDEQHNGHSNVARLSKLYRNEENAGYFRHYIQGVGTKFEQIGELGKSTFGSAFGSGGEARIIWGLLQVLNSIHFFIEGKKMFDTYQMGLLASDRPNQRRDFPTEDNRLFDQIEGITGMRLAYGLNSNWQGTRHKFLTQCASVLQAKLKKVTAGVSGIYIDVFGFSRGAAQARVFCTWLYESLLVDGKLCGTDAKVRMLGIFDTVASVSLSQTGHQSWASAENLRIHPAIQNCLHFVSLHEFRNNFPLDSVCVDGVLPRNCCEQSAPGVHSDVGGGYRPGDQGKGIRITQPNPNDPYYRKAVADDSDKLSQLPLNLMLAAASPVQ